MGSGWWFNDTKYGMLKQLKSLSEAGLLMNFVGMLTDSKEVSSPIRVMSISAASFVISSVISWTWRNPE